MCPRWKYKAAQVFRVACVRKPVRATDDQQRGARWEEANHQARKHKFVTRNLLFCQIAAEVSVSVRGMCNSEQSIGLLRCILQAEDTMNWKPQDWIEHASFGLGRVNENRGDRMDIDFINFGSKTILMTTELKSAMPPADVKSPNVKGKSRSPRIKVGV